MISAVWNFLCVVGSGDRALESLWLLWLYTQKLLDLRSLIPEAQECDRASSAQAKSSLHTPYIYL